MVTSERTSLPEKCSGFKKCQKSYNAFYSQYEKLKPCLENARVQLEKHIKMIQQKNKSSAGAPRIEYVTGRTKEDYSILRKAWEEHIRPTDAFTKFSDLVGIRIVVNNLCDVQPMVALIRQLPDDFQFIKEDPRKDDGGYNALHIDGLYLVKQGKRRQRVPAEIQIRTLLQDAWAVLTHHDVYRNRADIPELARGVSENLSRTLASLDELGDKFRKEMKTKVKPPNSLSENDALDKEAITCLFSAAFNEFPSQFEVQHLSNVAGAFPEAKAGDVKARLTKEILQRLREIHADVFRGYLPTEPSNLELFEHCLLYVFKGEQHAYAAYRRKLEAQRAEIDIDAVVISEEMPETLQELVKALKWNGGSAELGPSVPWEALYLLGAIRNCPMCGERMLVGVDIEPVLQDYYSVDDASECASLIASVWSGPVDGESGGCSWCENAYNKF